MPIMGEAGAILRHNPNRCCRRRRRRQPCLPVKGLFLAANVRGNVAHVVGRKSHFHTRVAIHRLEHKLAGLGQLEALANVDNTL